MPFVDFDNPDLVNVTRIMDKFDSAIFYIVLLTCKFLQFCLDFVTDLLFGYTTQYGTRMDREQAKAEYEHSAQIAKVVGRGCLSTLQIVNRWNFLLKHIEYVHPKYVLENDNVTIMAVTKEEVLFCVTDDPR